LRPDFFTLSSEKSFLIIVFPSGVSNGHFSARAVVAQTLVLIVTPVSIGESAGFSFSSTVGHGALLS
jgi:hypothetical protein